MATLKDLVERMRAFRDALPSVLPEVARSMSMAAKALAERTIKDKGFGEMYSLKDVPAWFLRGRELNKRGATYIANVEASDYRYTNWEKFRKAQGLQTQYVDLTFSGKMWAGMFPQEARIRKHRYIAPLGNNTREGQKKMNYNYSRYGNFIGKALTGDNLDKMYQVAQSEIIRLMEQKLKL